MASGKIISNGAGSFTNVVGDTGWSAVTGYAVHHYRILPDGNLQVSGATQHVSITASLAINSSNPIAVAARPSTIKKISSGNAPLSELNVELGTNGVFTALANSSAAGTKAIMNAIVDLT
jgi:hypothetical protein